MLCWLPAAMGDRFYNDHILPLAWSFSKTRTSNAVESAKTVERWRDLLTAMKKAGAPEGFLSLVNELVGFDTDKKAFVSTARRFKGGARKVRAAFERFEERGGASPTSRNKKRPRNQQS